MGLGRVFQCFCPSTCSNLSCFCMNDSFDNGEEEIEREALVEKESSQIVRIRDIVEESQAAQTLAFQLKPKRVVLMVSMHCDGCAKQVEKHISKMEGVITFKVDLEAQKVIVVGDIAPSEVLESVSKIKFAELWASGSPA